MVTACRAFLHIAPMGFAVGCTYCFSVARASEWPNPTPSSTALTLDRTAQSDVAENANRGSWSRLAAARQRVGGQQAGSLA
jgi:hypothetical protein